MLILFKVLKKEKRTITQQKNILSKIQKMLPLDNFDFNIMLSILYFWVNRK